MRIIHSDGTREWMKVREYAATLTEDDFEQVTWPTEEGGKTVYAHLVKTWVRKLGPCQVLIVRLNLNDGPEGTRYWVTTRLEDNAEQVIAHVAHRWVIEVLFADIKELMGSDHYQVRTARAIVRFWALGLCLYQFLDEIRADHRSLREEHLSLGQARQQVRESHREMLLDWLITQAQAGVPRDEIHQSLQPAMRL